MDIQRSLTLDDHIHRDLPLDDNSQTSLARDVENRRV
jgi:hypothetical protein